jgi:hypothetical protein
MTEQFECLRQNGGFVHIERGTDATKWFATNIADGVAFKLAPMCASHEALMCARMFASNAGLALQSGLRHILRKRRGKWACPVLNRLRNILPSLLNEFVTPVLELLGDDFNAAGLFYGAHSDLSGIIFAQARFRHL